MTELDDERLDGFCWQLVHDRNWWFPPDESAEKCIEAFDEPEEQLESEQGYHRGRFIAACETIEHFGLILTESSDREKQIQAVEKRAKRYARASDGLDVPKTWEELETEYEAN